MVFVPLKYAYPSKLKTLRTPTAVLGTLWCLALSLWVVAPERFSSFPLLELSLAFPIYYFVLSLWLGGLHRRTG
jgi:hypothetical protein